MVNGWFRKGVTLAVIAAGLALGRMDGAAPVGAPVPPRVAEKSQEQINREIFAAIRSMLAGANLPAQDMPRQIISVEPVGQQRYKVHMAMVQGDGWFEAWWDGTRWQVRGVNPPS